MPKNVKGGKHKHAKKQSNADVKKELILKDEGQEYAIVIRSLGNGRIEVNCFDGVTRLAHMRGNLKRKKIFINLGDIILVSLRDYQDTKADVIHKYSADEARKLKTMGELPATAEINSTERIGEDDNSEIPFEFDEI